MEQWRELARALGRAPKYSINVAGDPARRDARSSRDAAAALKQVAAQDIGHPAIAARERAQQTPAVVNARAKVLKADYQRNRLREDVVAGKVRGDEREAAVQRMHRLEAATRRHAQQEKAAYENAYKAELKKIPKPPREAPKRAPKKAFTVGRYQPMSVSIAEIARARQNRRVLELERRMADLDRATSGFGGGDRREFESVAQAYYRARDKEIVRIRTGKTAISHPPIGTRRPSGTIRNTHAWPYEHPREHSAAAKLGWSRRHSHTGGFHDNPNR